MRVYRGLSELPRRGSPSAVTIGNFDGVHLGHVTMLRRLLLRAEESGAIPTVLTFSPHPQSVLHGEAPPSLATPKRKLELLAEHGVKRIVILKFNKKFSLTEPEEFISRILIDELRTREIVVGANFRFGRMARGDVTMLKSAGHESGFVVDGVRLAELEHRTLSSTEIRHALAAGDIDWANKALGRPHSVPGKVVSGAGRGKGLGYPTANLRPEPGFCLPATGIYAGRVRLRDRIMPAAMSVGHNPTFGRNPLSVEAFVLDFDGTLRSRHVEFEFVSRIRDEAKFETAAALSAAIAADVAEVRRLLHIR
ncbi:MAG TPA: bifunctional riboflavin kinase/FAD synthetase [Actinomycetota bacterium]|nr:bifunctional riboflavin kinase/FAD synthetase [Actinomycetota bacterium]